MIDYHAFHSSDDDDDDDDDDLSLCKKRSNKKENYVLRIRTTEIIHIHYDLGSVASSEEAKQENFFLTNNGFRR